MGIWTYGGLNMTRQQNSNFLLLESAFIHPLKCNVDPVFASVPFPPNPKNNDVTMFSSLFSLPRIFFLFSIVALCRSFTGVALLGMRKRPPGLAVAQSLAAVGQPALMAGAPFTTTKGG